MTGTHREVERIVVDEGLPGAAEGVVGVVVGPGQGVAVREVDHDGHTVLEHLVGPAARAHAERAAVTGPPVRIELSDVAPGYGRHVVHDPRALNHSTERDARLPFPTSAVVHQRHCPPFDQANVGACVGNAGAGLMMTDPFWVPGRAWTEQDALRLYSLSTQLDQINGQYPPNDTGSSGDGLGRALRSLGLASGYRWAFGLRQTLATLAQFPVCAGLPWYDSMERSRSDGFISISRDATVVGGHEICIVGVDPAAQTVRFAQSWGTGWGDRGYGVMSWATLDRLLHERGDIMTVTVPPPTSLTAAPVPAAALAGELGASS